ncbi:MAG: type 4a pilus biogenesis protein PilO [Mariprofundaceae bacterium]
MIKYLDVLNPVLSLEMWKKLAGVAGVVVLLSALYVYFIWMPIKDEIDQEQRNVLHQQQILERNKVLARDLPRKKEEFARLEKELKVALNMLPRASQIPDLLENVSRAGKDSGLEFSVFKPLAEVPKQFYAEVPVDLRVTGSYRQLLTFLSRVGEMPRIVDVKDLEIQDGGGGNLQVKGLAVTYRFIEASERKRLKAARKGR